MNNHQVHIHLHDPGYAGTGDQSLLSKEEMLRASAFKFEQDRHLYIEAHVFLRKTLSTYALIKPEDWVFECNEYGKPFIVNPGYDYLQFNLSHTNGLIACAISRYNPVGIDVEERRALADLDTLCEHALSPIELRDIKSTSNVQEKNKRFFTYWTLKEAYLKATGMGLSVPLQTFGFTQQSTQSSSWYLVNEPYKQQYEQQKDWRFKTRVLDKHCVSIGVKHIDDIGVDFLFSGSAKNSGGKHK